MLACSASLSAAPSFPARVMRTVPGNLRPLRKLQRLMDLKAYGQFICVATSSESTSTVIQPLIHSSLGPTARLMVQAKYA